MLPFSSGVRPNWARWRLYCIKPPRGRDRWSSFPGNPGSVRRHCRTPLCARPASSFPESGYPVGAARNSTARESPISRSSTRSPTSFRRRTPKMSPTCCDRGRPPGVYDSRRCSALTGLWKGCIARRSERRKNACCARLWMRSRPWRPRRRWCSTSRIYTGQIPRASTCSDASAERRERTPCSWSERSGRRMSSEAIARLAISCSRCSLTVNAKRSHWGCSSGSM